MSKLKNYSHFVDAFNAIEQHMNENPDYAYGWHANIAMAMYDAMPEIFWLPDDTEKLKIANKGASIFMKRAFDIDTSQDMLSKDKK